MPAYHSTVHQQQHRPNLPHIQRILYTEFCIHIFYLFKWKWAKLNLSKNKNKNIVQTRPTITPAFSLQHRSKWTGKKLCFKRKLWLLSEWFFILQSLCEGNSEPLPQAETAVEVWGCSGITIYTHRFTKKYCHTSYWLCHEYQWLFFFWTHSTKQTVKNVHAWLCSTWPSPYIQFNGIMNTQYKGIVHDTQLLCTMHELCHWFCSFKGLYFW